MAPSLHHTGDTANLQLGVADTGRQREKFGTHGQWCLTETPASVPALSRSVLVFELNWDRCRLAVRAIAHCPWAFPPSTAPIPSSPSILGHSRLVRLILACRVAQSNSHPLTLPLRSTPPRTVLYCHGTATVRTPTVRTPTAHTPTARTPTVHLPWSILVRSMKGIQSWHLQVVRRKSAGGTKPNGPQGGRWVC